jgi:hypothetical protein
MNPNNDWKFAVMREDLVLDKALSNLPQANPIPMWQCPTCGHKMTQSQSMAYNGCPKAFHFVQHVRIEAKPA